MATPSDLSEVGLTRRRLVLIPAVMLLSGLTTALFLPPTIRFIPVLVAALLVVLYFAWIIVKTKVTYYRVDEELLYLITHMYAVSTGKPPRARLFKIKTIAGAYNLYDRYLYRIATLATEWGFSFVKAIGIVARKVRNKYFRDFLTRLGEILNVGEDPERYLDVERRATLMEYQSQYGRAMESMKLLLGVYTSTISSSMFLAITTIIYTLLMGSDPRTIIFAYFGIMVGLASVTYVIYRIVPRDRVSHNLRGVKPPEKIKYRRILIFTFVMVIVTYQLVYNITHMYELSLASAAIVLISPGLYARRVESRIKELDSFFSIFVRSFGITYSVLPHVPQALASVLRSNFGILTPYLRRLQNRLKLGVKPERAWLAFIGETWSELIRRNVNVLYDSIEVGGNLAEIGTLLSDMSFRLQDLKKQREQIAKAFEVTLYILHLILVSVVSFILELVKIFNQMLYMVIATAPGVSVSILPFQFVDIGFLEIATTILIIFVSILNAITIRVARGGMYETVWVQIGLLIALSIISMTAIRLATAAMFESLLRFQEVVQVPT